MTVNSTLPTRRSSPQSINSPAISRPTRSRHEASTGPEMPRRCLRVAGHLVGWPDGCRLDGCFSFGVRQACDEIAGDDADCYVEESVRRRATPPGLASSSSR